MPAGKREQLRKFSKKNKIHQNKTYEKEELKQVYKFKN
jgi:hypothetical protein